MVAKYHQEQHQKELRAEKDEAQRLHRIAANLAKMVKEFWSNVEKVQYVDFCQFLNGMFWDRVTDVSVLVTRWC